MCTDSHQSYIKFVDDFGLEHKRIESGKRRTDDFYNIQRLNSFHSRLKILISRFKGVSTKYLNNYLSWFSFLFIAHRLSKTSRIVDLFMEFATKNLSITKKQIQDRKVEFI